MDPIEYFTAEWTRVGISHGDLVLVHSSIKRILRRAKDQGVFVTPKDILASLLAAVGPNGTLVLPLFNFGFARGEPFDIRNTKSEMGVLTEEGRLHEDAVRTGHPIYSFAAIGGKANLFEGVDNYSGYSAESPFGIIHREGGKIAIIDLPDQNSMTFYHYVEENKRVSYRYNKEFRGKYTDKNGDVSDRAFGLFVRDLDAGIVTHVNPAGELAWSAGLYKGDRPGIGCGMRLIRASELFDLTAGIIDSGQAEGLLFKRER